MREALLVANNEFSKTYKIGTIELFVAKAFDEKDGKHYVVCSIPELLDLNIVKLQLPIAFDYEEQRDMFFDKFDANDFMKAMYKKIEDNRKLSQQQNGEN